MKVPDLSLTDSCTFMNCILSGSSISLHPMRSMTSSSTSSSSQHHCKNWLSSGRLRVKQPLAINASPSQVYKYVLKYDISYVFGLGQIYIFDLIWFDLIRRSAWDAVQCLITTIQNIKLLRSVFWNIAWSWYPMWALQNKRLISQIKLPLQGTTTVKLIRWSVLYGD